MADSRRWDNGSGVRREDQFVRPPAFRDEHDSSHLSPQDASWHGSGSRHVALAASLAVIAGIAAVALMFLVSPSGGGADAAAQAPQGASAGDDGLANDAGALPVPSVQGNSTTGLPVPPLPVP